MGQPTQKTERQTWQYRAIERTRGNQTLIGTILLAALGKSHRLKGKRVGLTATIRSDGQVISAYQSAQGTLFQNMPLCGVDDMISGFRRLADALKLSDSERIAMFNELRKWISHDYRPKPDWQTGVPVTVH